MKNQYKRKLETKKRKLKTKKKWPKCYFSNWEENVGANSVSK